nr:MAG TPA_asm: protein of unknown function (DUF4969) [Caudoviricetes sp.]
MRKIFILLLALAMAAIILIADSHGTKVHNRDQIFSLNAPSGR